MELLNKYPVIKLHIGLNVANFSSPHNYTFDTGEILPACEKNVAVSMSLSPHHTRNEKDIRGIKVYDVEVLYHLNDRIKEDILKMAEMDAVDIILVPYPVMTAWKREANYTQDEAMLIALDKLRVCKLTDKVTKVISSTSFCV